MVRPRAIFQYYKGSAWIPAFAFTHASGRAGEHFDMFDSIFNGEDKRFLVMHILRSINIVYAYSMSSNAKSSI